MKLKVVLLYLVAIPFAYGGSDLAEYPFLFGDGTSTNPKILHRGQLLEVELLSDQSDKSKTVLASLYALDWRIKAATCLGPTTRLYVEGTLDEKKNILYINDWFLKKPFYVMNYKQGDAIALEGIVDPNFKPIVMRSYLEIKDFSNSNSTLGILTEIQKKSFAESNVR